MIYDNIKALCDKRGLSIRRLEIQAGLGNGVIGGWKNSSPTVDNIKAVAKVLNIKVDKLIN